MGKTSEEKPSVVPDLFRGFRLGIVTIFGILLPGVWFVASIVFYAMSACGQGNATSFCNLIRSASVPQPLAWIIGFVFVYVIGAQLRSISPNGIDRLSIWWRHKLNKDWRIARGDRFPYQSLPSYFRHFNMPRFAECLPWDNEKSKCACSTIFVNYAKLCVTKRDPQLGDYLDREEAFIRAMSGVALGAMASTLLGLVVLGYAPFVVHSRPSWHLFCLTVAANLIVFATVTVNFHRQRLRELSKVVGALYHLFHDYDGCHPPYGECDNASEDSGSNSSLA